MTRHEDGGGCCSSGPDHHNHEGHHDHEKKLCVALVQGEDVILYDSSGASKTFTHTHTESLCFENHGGVVNLTPCLNKEGTFGMTDCECGDKDPHLHAHNKDRCHDSENLEILKLSDKQVSIPISESMPNACNSHQVQLQTTRKRLHPVRHEDHIDYLVSHGNEIHLEHSCDSCGGGDIHGSFTEAGRHKLSQDVDVRFIRPSKAAFKFVEWIERKYDLESDKQRNLGHLGTLTRRTVRSTFICNQICCSAEIPQVRKVLKMDGITDIMINVPLKHVTVEHDPKLVSALEISQILIKNHLGGVIKLNGAASYGRSSFHVQNICCAAEIPPIRAILERLDGVSKVSFNVTAKILYVDHDGSIISAQGICDSLNKEKWGATIKHDGAEAETLVTFVTSTLKIERMDSDSLSSFFKMFETSQVQSHSIDGSSIKVIHNPMQLTAQGILDKLKAKTVMTGTVAIDGSDPSAWLETMKDFPSRKVEVQDEYVSRPKPTVILSGIFWVISMLSLAGGKLEHLKYVGLASVVFGLPPIALKAFRTLRRRQFDTNCLMFFASVGAVALQEYAEAAAVVFLFAASEWLEVRATSRARQALSAIVQLRPDTANIIHPTTRELIRVPAEAVPVGTLVSVRSGDKVPCDGFVVEGSSALDESSLTGESRPISKIPNSKVSGGTVNVGLAPLVVRTTSTAEDSAVAKLIRLVEEAQANRSETEKMVDEFARWYTPVVVLAALLMCSIPWIFGSDTGREWTTNGLILIVVACPCALIISTPVSYVAGLAATAQRGILIKGGAHLESLGKTTTICFDKTGTLTRGQFGMLELITTESRFSRREVLEYLTLMEERASHPVAQALVAGARNEGVIPSGGSTLEKHEILAGEGVVGVINGKDIYVGNERLFQRLNEIQKLPDTVKSRVKEWEGLGGTIGFMSIEGSGIVCGFVCADAVRSEARSVLDNLQRLGINTLMLTGDNRFAARAIGMQVGLPVENVKAELLPEEKLEIVRALTEERIDPKFSCLCRRKNVVAFVGDGVNDAPSLAEAAVGIAMGEGAALAMETADATLLDSNLEKLEYSVRMGRRVIRKIKENVVFSLVVKFVVLGFALAGSGKLWAAIASDVGAMILVTLNAMTLLPSRRKDARTTFDDIEKASASSSASGETASDAEQANVCTKGCCGTTSSAKEASTMRNTMTLTVSIASGEKSSKDDCCRNGKCSKESTRSKSSVVDSKCCDENGKCSKDTGADAESASSSCGTQRGICSKRSDYSASPASVSRVSEHVHEDSSHGHSHSYHSAGDEMKSHCHGGHTHEHQH